MADVTPILIKDLAAQTTLADTDYFIVGGADAKKITVAQMKEALVINELNTKFQNFSLYNAQITGSIYLDNVLHNSNSAYFYKLVGIMVDGASLDASGRYFIIAKMIATNDGSAATAYVSSDKLLKYVHIGEGNEYGWNSF